MATIKDIRRRIRSVQSTQQITKAMEMVAAAKLRRAQERASAARPYALKMTEILQSLAGAAGELHHPLFEVRDVRRRAVVVMASDKGLCGSFNANVFRHVEVELRGADRSHIDLIPVGRRAAEYFGRRGWTGSLRLPEMGDQVGLARASALARHLIGIFERGEVDRVDLVYTHFVSTASRRVVMEDLLPIRPREPGVVAHAGMHAGAHAHANNADANANNEDANAHETTAAHAVAAAGRPYIFEPSPRGIFADLLPRYVQTRVMSAMAESLASEHSARLISMGAATKNAGDMISALTLIRNKLRQAAITKEISELVGGAEALR